MTLAAWEAALWDAAREELGAEPLGDRALVPAILARSERYTTRRDALAERLAGPAAARDLAARALFFGAADLAKVAVPVDELARAGRLPPAAPLRVLDVGAGAGAMTLGLAAATGRPLDVVAIDRDARALAILAAAARRAPTPLGVRTVAGDATRSLAPDLGRFDVVLAGTVVNELPAPARLPLVLALVREHLAPGGVCLVLEPALRETSRALHELRDALVAAGVYVAAPCTRQATCPALVDPRDWCHEDRAFQPPPRLAALARATGLRQHGLKTSYLTLLGEPAPLRAAPGDGGELLRVVSGPLDQKGTVERFVCGPAGRRRVRVLRRAKGPSLDALAGSERGDVLVLAPDGTFRRG